MYFAFKWIDKNFLYTAVIIVSLYIFNSAIDARLYEQSLCGGVSESTIIGP
jgi:hypothetical protein